MTDLRSLTILGMIGRLNMLIDEGYITLTPAEVKRCIAEGSILERLRISFGDFPEFTPVHQAEGILLLKEWKGVVESYRGREETKMGVQHNGLCLLVGYCLEMLMQRNVREVFG